MAHRLGWCLHYKEPPPDKAQIDHINGDPDDNRIANLRLASPSQNQANTSRHANSRGRFKGVRMVKKGSYRAWAAYIRREGKSINIGTFKSDVEAARAYDTAAVQYFGEYARTNFHAMHDATPKDGERG